MFIVKRRSELVRFGLFLVLVGLMGYYVAGRVELWRSSERSDTRLAPVTNGASAGLSPIGMPELAGANSDGADSFADFRLGRERDRGLLRETLREIMESESTDADTKKQASQQLLNLGGITMREASAEALVKARGYEDVVVHLAQETAQVMIKAVSISESQFLQLVDIVSNVTGMQPGAIQVWHRER